MRGDAERIIRRTSRIINRKNPSAQYALTGFYNGGIRVAELMSGVLLGHVIRVG